MALTAAHLSTFSAERQPTCLDRVRSNKNTVLWVTAAALLVGTYGNTVCKCIVTAPNP
jgi:hypothetical protein